MSREQSVSTEAIGQFSELQIQELKTLGEVIFYELGLDRENPQDKEDAMLVLMDCIRRGLQITGRVWFRPNESVVNTYRAGLSEREKIANQLKEIFGSFQIHNFAASDEIENLRQFLTEKSLALSLRIQEAEEVIEKINKRKATIAKLHSQLFSHSSLAVESTSLKQEATEAKGLDTLDRLFLNFLAYLALYKNPGVDVEPKDLVALNELWKDREVKDNGHVGLLTATLEIARNLKLDEEAVEIYCLKMLDTLSNELANIADVEMLYGSLFIFTGKQIADETREFTNPPETAKITFPEEELESARNKYSEYKQKLIAYLEPIYRQDHLSDDYGSDFFKYLESLTALEFLFLCKDSLDEDFLYVEGTKVRPEADFDSVPLLTYMETLNILHSADIDDFKDSKVNLAVKTFLVEFIQKQLFKPSADWNYILSRLPLESLLSFLNSIDAGSLPEAQKATFTNFDLELWFKLMSQARVEYNASKTNPEGGRLHRLFEFSPDSVGLIPFLELLPEEKLNQLAEKLRREIKLD